MAKNESTAVNDLINLVSTQTPRPVGADEDLMFQDPSKRPPTPKPPIRIASPRVTGTVPALDAAGAVEPLPRGRGANGTQKNAQIAPPAVRVSTAPPSRGTTVPSLGTGSSASALPPPAPGARRSAPPPLRSTAGFDLSNMSSVGHNLPASSIGITVPAVPLTAPEEREADRAEARATAKRPPTPAPIAAPAPATPSHADMTAHAPWFEETGASERSTGPIVHEETFVGSVSQLRQPRTTAQWLTKMWPMMTGMVVLGGAIGLYLVVHSPAKTDAPAADTAAAAAPAADTAPVTAAATAPDTAPAPATATATTPAAAPAPVAVAAAAPAPEAETAPALPAIAPVRGKIVFADVRIDSKPEGATVMIVDRGRTSFLGTTPLATSLDASRQYDLVLTYKDRPPQTEHIDPATTPRLTVTMHHDASYAPAPAIAAPAPAAAETPAAKPAKGPAKPAAKPAKLAVAAAGEETPSAEPAAAKPPAASGEGTLMISSKPPCEISVDGKPTGLMTPQRAIKLSTGAHKITLTNAGENVSKTITVSITADQATKVIQDLMAK